jgi:ribonuclease-3
MTAASPNRDECVADRLGYRMRDSELLQRACTHTSRCGAQATPADKRRQANERLEFLGDALLGGALCQLLLASFPDADEGELSRMKAHLVSRATLARVIEETGLLAHCLVGSQMAQPWPDSVKANLMESILAAIHLDGGWDALVGAVDRLLRPHFADPLAHSEDARMRLQAWCLEHHKRLPVYTHERSGGNDHSPEFAASVAIGEARGHGRGTSRRRAEGAAAADLMRQLE